MRYFFVGAFGFDVQDGGNAFDGEVHADECVEMQVGRGKTGVDFGKFGKEMRVHRIELLQEILKSEPSLRFRKMVHEDLLHGFDVHVCQGP